MPETTPESGVTRYFGDNMDLTQKFLDKHKSKLDSLSQFIDKKEYPADINEQRKSLEIDGLMKLFREIRKDLTVNRYRPIYHFAAVNWIGDPNGLCYWQDKYHIFYQGHLPGMTGVCWGHAVRVCGKITWNFSYHFMEQWYNSTAAKYHVFLG